MESLAQNPNLMAGLVAGFVVIVGFLLLGGESASGHEKRIAQLAEGRDGGGKGGMFSFMRSDDTSNRRKQIEESLAEIEKTQKDRSRQRKTLKARLVQADWAMKPQTFVLISTVLAVVFGGITLIVSGGKLPVAGGAALVGGFGLPRFILKFAITRRQKKFTANFSDAMDIIVRGVRSGLPLGDCLKVIAHESPEPVASEFKLVVQGESVGVPIEVCLDRMYERIPVSEVNFFSTVLNIQRTTGGNLGEALSNLSGVLRGRKILREKIKALSSEAKASAMIIGALPPVVMLLVTFAAPDYMSDLYFTSRGQKNMMIGAAMMVFGVVWMRKMINFKF